MLVQTRPKSKRTSATWGQAEDHTDLFLIWCWICSNLGDILGSIASLTKFREKKILTFGLFELRII